MSRSKDTWITAPISPTCEVYLSYKPTNRCSKPTAFAYPANYYGWMALCELCAKPHSEAVSVGELLARGGEIETLTFRQQQKRQHKSGINMANSSKKIEIVSVKCGRKDVVIAWSQGEDEHRDRWVDEPLPSFRRAFEALAPIVGTICHFPAKYHETGLRVVALHLGTKGGVRTASVTAQKDLDDASEQFMFTTPERLLENPTEEGAFSPPLESADAELVDEAIEQAKAYLRGDRSQSEINFGKTEEEKAAEKAIANNTPEQPALGLDESATGKPVKKKGAK